jgi:hypothetical protein
VVRTSKDNDIEPVYGTRHGVIMMKTMILKQCMAIGKPKQKRENLDE